MGSALLAVSFGPAGLGLAANFRQLITVLGVLAGAGIFNGVTKYVVSTMIIPNSCAAYSALHQLRWYLASLR